MRLALPSDAVRAGPCMSGTDDTEPVRLSWRSHRIVLKDEMEDAICPRREPGRVGAPRVVSFDGPGIAELWRQARDFAAAPEADPPAPEIRCGGSIAGGRAGMTGI